MKIEDRLLFLKYALPCASTLVKRKKVTQEYVEELMHLVSDGKVPKENAESMFKVANAMCDSIATRMGKTAIDAEVIRQYFLLEHNKVVDDRYELMGDFNPMDCKTYAGKVLEISDGSAIVETRLGRKKYKNLFAKGVKKGDVVAVHFSYIVEKIDNKIAKQMNGRLGGSAKV